MKEESTSRYFSETPVGDMDVLDHMHFILMGHPECNHRKETIKKKKSCKELKGGFFLYIKKICKEQRQNKEKAPLYLYRGRISRQDCSSADF